MIKTDAVKHKIKTLPNEPGVYQMKDRQGIVIYVGKAKNLKNRVSTYFRKQAYDNFKTKALVKEIHDFEILITRTELEALLSERTLIRTHNPKFNVLLRDDREYPYVRINLNDDWPRLEKVRSRKDDGGLYIGPFPNSSQLGLTLKTIFKIFPLIRCSRHEFANAKRPCNYYHMNMCLGPCVLDVEKKHYAEMIQKAIMVLKGNNKQVLEDIKIAMTKASDNKDFETAAQLRDQLFALKKMSEKQYTMVQDIDDADAIFALQEQDQVVFFVISIRNGRLVGQDHFLMRNHMGLDDDSIVSLISQYYDQRYLPQQIILGNEFEDTSRVKDLVSALAHLNQKQASINIKTTPRGSAKKIIELTIRNAKHALQDHKIKYASRRTDLALIQEQFELKNFPNRIECIDISNTGSTAIVASNVVFMAGHPAKNLYRIYNIKTVGDDGPDDFQSMREVVERRLSRARKDGDAPDLLIIDGGKGQLSAALSSFEMYKDLDIDLVSLAKSHIKEQHPDLSRAPSKSPERIYKPHEDAPRILEPGSMAFRLFTQIRDEAHRFAITKHRKKRDQLGLSSSLETIPGVGPKMRQKLLTHFGSIDNIQRASLDQLKKIPAMKETTATAIHSFFQESRDRAPVEPSQSQEETD